MAIIAALSRKVETFLALPVFVRLWLLPTWVLLGLSKALILVVSFSRLAPHLGENSGAAPWVPLLNECQELRALQVGRVVRLAAKYTPWDSNCLPQAVTARLLLGLYGIPYTLFFGISQNPDGLGIKAHAWIAAGKIRVTGGTSFGQFSVVGCFVSPKLQGIIGF